MLLQGRAQGLRDVMPDAEVDEDSLSRHTVLELKKIAKGMGISGRSNKKKEQLIQMIKLHVNPTPEKRRESAKRRQQAGIQKQKMREERRPKPKDKYPKTTRAPKKAKEAAKDPPTRDEERLKQVRKEQQVARRKAKEDLLQLRPSPDGQERQIPEGEMKTAQCGEEVAKILRKTPTPERPREKRTLLDHIRSQRTSSWSRKANDGHILNWLKQRGFISFEDNDAESVKYNI